MQTCSLSPPCGLFECTASHLLTCNCSQIASVVSKWNERHFPLLHILLIYCLPLSNCSMGSLRDKCVPFCFYLCWCTRALGLLFWFSFSYFFLCVLWCKMFKREILIYSTRLCYCPTQCYNLINDLIYMQTFHVTWDVDVELRKGR